MGNGLGGGAECGVDGTPCGGGGGVATAAADDDVVGRGLRGALFTLLLTGADHCRPSSEADATPFLERESENESDGSS